MSKIIIDNMVITGTDLRMTKMDSQDPQPRLQRVSAADVSDLKSVLLCSTDDGYAVCSVLHVYPEYSKVLVGVGDEMKIVRDTDLWTVL
jgi:hypothetical protein